MTFAIVTILLSVAPAAMALAAFDELAKDQRRPVRVPVRRRAHGHRSFL